MQLVLAVVRVNDIHEDYHWPINAWVELYTVTLSANYVVTAEQNLKLSHHPVPRRPVTTSRPGANVGVAGGLVRVGYWTRRDKHF